MNEKGKYKEDFLLEFISPDRREKAPEGFTSNVMTRIQMEPVLYKSDVKKEKNMVPYIAACFTLILFLAALLIPGSKADTFTLALVNIFRNLKISMPEIDLSSIFSLSIPSLLIDIIIGIFVLFLFDRALYAIFHRQKSQNL